MPGFLGGWDAPAAAAEFDQLFDAAITEWSEKARVGCRRGGGGMQERMSAGLRGLLSARFGLLPFVPTTQLIPCLQPFWCCFSWGASDREHRRLFYALPRPLAGACSPPLRSTGSCLAWQFHPLALPASHHVAALLCPVLRRRVAALGDPLH